LRSPSRQSINLKDYALPAGIAPPIRIAVRLTPAAQTIMLVTDPGRLIMLRLKLTGLMALLIGCSLLAAQDDAKPKLVPAAFECFNINGKAKGRPQCLVCKFGLSPVVLIFTKEPAEGKDGPLNDLLDQLNKLTELPDFVDREFSVGVVFISTDALDSSNNAEEKDADKLIKEAVNREKLVKRLEERAKPFKKDGDKERVIIGCVPEAPKKYNLDPKMEQTILFYDRMKIVDTWPFEPGAMEAKDVEAIVKRVRDAVPLRKQIGGKKK
jgi:hypothetical protein